jgi:phage gp37-like protein
MLQNGRHIHTENRLALASNRLPVSPVAARHRASEMLSHFARYDKLGDKDKESPVPAEKAGQSDDSRMH